MLLQVRDSWAGQAKFCAESCAKVTYLTWKVLERSQSRFFHLIQVCGSQQNLQAQHLRLIASWRSFTKILVPFNCRGSVLRKKKQRFLLFEPIKHIQSIKILCPQLVSCHGHCCMFVFKLRKSCSWNLHIFVAQTDTVKILFEGESLVDLYISSLRDSSTSSPFASVFLIRWIADYLTLRPAASRVTKTIATRFSYLQQLKGPAASMRRNMTKRISNMSKLWFSDLSWYLGRS